MTVKELKKMIERKCRMIDAKQKLIFADARLEDYRVLYYCIVLYQ